MRSWFQYLNILFIFCLHYGCASQSNKSIRQRSADNVDSLYKEIPSRYLQEKVRKYKLNVESILGLQSIGGGYRDLQIRLWVSHGTTERDTAQLFVFKKNNASFTGELYTYLLEYDSLWNPVSTRSKTIKALIPHSGWNIFMDSLHKFGIATLPDYENLQGYYLSSDPFGVTVEYASSNKYRIYQYPDYDYYAGKFGEAAKMYKIIRLLERQYNVKAVVE